MGEDSVNVKARESGFGMNNSVVHLQNAGF